MDIVYIILWSTLAFIAIHLLVQAYIAISDAIARRTMLRPDQDGRYPIITFRTRRGLFVFDPSRNWGITRIDDDGSIYIKEAPLELIEGAFDVEHMRAYSRVVLPQTVTQNPSYTYAPSTTRETTAIDNNPNVDLAQRVIEEDKKEKQPLPTSVNFFDIIDQRQPGNIIIGVKESGELFQLPLLQAFHQLVVGMSGYGKSIYLRALVLQLILEREISNIRIALADIENNTFPEFRFIEGVEWYAGTYPEIGQLTQQLEREVDRRKSLYESFDAATPRDIERYNTLAKKFGKPELPIIVLLVDEFTALMDRANAAQKAIVNSVYQIALRARKYGIYIVLAGHSFKSDVIDTTVTNQFAVSLSFRVRSVHQSVSIIGEPGAERITQPGEALIKLRDGEIVRLQTPFLDDDELLELLETLPTQKSDPVVPELVRAIVEFSATKLNNKATFKEIEHEFRTRGFSRSQIYDMLRWMDRNQFTARDSNHGRILTEKALQSIKKEESQ